MLCTFPPPGFRLPRTYLTLPQAALTEVRNGLRATLGEPAFSRIWSRGRLTPIDRIVEAL